MKILSRKQQMPWLTMNNEKTRIKKIGNNASTEETIK